MRDIADVAVETLRKSRPRKRKTPPGLRGIRGRRRRIITLTDPGSSVLRSRSKSVRVVDPSTRRLIADMLATMRGATGVGLAAPQIGAPQRVLVAEVGRRVVALVNPRLRRKRGSQIGLEGCLSIPGIYADVRRAQDVAVDGLNALGRRITVRGAGLLARVLQHEIDHLNGVLFIDRIAPSRIIEHPLDRLRVARRRRAAVRPAPERVGIVPAVAARRYRRMVRT